MARSIGGILRGCQDGVTENVGGAQDLVASGADLASVMHAGGWRGPNMPSLYTRRLSVLRGGMAALHSKPALAPPGVPEHASSALAATALDTPALEP